MAEANCTLTVTVNEAPALHHTLKTDGGLNPPAHNLTSDAKKDLSEEKLIEINAAVLTDPSNNSVEDQINFLPVLGYQGLIAKGWSHILAGYPKTGKTELLTRAIAEWTNETLLYITEEPQQVWRHRLKRLSEELKIDHINLVFPLGAAPESILKRVHEGDETVVIIDTIRSFLGFIDETDNSEVNRVIAPYIKAAREKTKTIIFVHHMRKGCGQYGKGITGAHAFLGSVDIGLVLDRKKNNRRIISGEARIVDIKKCVYERLDDESFRMIGAAESLALEEVKRRILAARCSGWKSTKEVQLILGNPKPSNDQISKALQALAKEGRVYRDPPVSKGSNQGKTYRWQLSDQLEKKRKNAQVI